MNGGASASNRVVVYANETAADAAFAAFKARTTSACLSKTMAATLPAVLAENPKVAKKVSGLTVKMGPGKTAAMTNESAAIQGTTTVTLKNGKKAKVYVNEEAVVTGRALNLLEFVNVGEQLDGIHDHLVATTTGRLQGALGMNQAGETAALAGALVPVPGYEYVEATPEEVNSIATALAAPEVATYLNGRSIHSVVQNGTSVGIIMMTEFKPQYSAQPGFKTDAVASWAADDAESSAGTTQVSTGGNGQAMAIVTGSNGYTGHIFFAGGILVAIYSAGADPGGDAGVRRRVQRSRTRLSPAGPIPSSACSHGGPVHQDLGRRVRGSPDGDRIDGAAGRAGDGERADAEQELVAAVGGELGQSQVLHERDPGLTRSSMWTARNTLPSNGMHSMAPLSAPTAAISWSSTNETASRPRPGWR